MLELIPMTAEKMSRNLCLASLFGHSNESLFFFFVPFLFNTWHWGRISFLRKILYEKKKKKKVILLSLRNFMDKIAQAKVISLRSCTTVTFLHGIDFLYSYIGANPSTTFFVFTRQSRGQRGLRILMSLLCLLAYWVWLGAKSSFPKSTANGREGRSVKLSEKHVDQRFPSFAHQRKWQ